MFNFYDEISYIHEQNELVLDILNVTLKNQVLVADMALYLSYLFLFNFIFTLVTTLALAMLYTQVQNLILSYNENESIKNGEYCILNKT